MQTCEQTIDIPDASRNTYRLVEQEVNIGVHAFKSGNGKTAAAFFQSALHKLTENQPFYDHLTHNLLLSYRMHVEDALNAGDSEAASVALRDALALDIRGEMAGDNKFRELFARAYQELGLVLFRHRRFDESILCCRKAISIFDHPGSHINLLNALSVTAKPAILADFAPELTSDQLGRHIFIACVPKTASTFLKNVLIELTGYLDAFMVYSPGQFEQDVYLPTLRHTATMDTVTQQHCRASDANVSLMQAFGIKPVVLVRNIFDSVISLFDFYNNGAYSMSFHRADYARLDANTRLDLLIDNLGPWYFQFVATWADVEKQARLQIHWLTYEDLIRDKPSRILEVLRFHGLAAPMDGIRQKIEEVESQKRKTRFNKGVAGRGKAVLSEQQKDRIRSFAAYFPSTDFSRIGL